MTYEDIQMINCSEPGCPAEIKGHAWGKIKSGWFFQKNGERYCPDHMPPWVAAWRARKESSPSD